MSKHVSSLSAQLVTFDTEVPFSEVIARLDREVNKQGQPTIMSRMAAATSRAEIEAIVNDIKGSSDFLYFGEMGHHKWLSIHDGVKYPATVNYMIGNPLIAQTMLRHDRHAALAIPPRITILEKDDGKGTQVIYYLPSSLFGWSDNEQLLAAARNLDNKLEQLIALVTST